MRRYFSALVVLCVFGALAFLPEILAAAPQLLAYFDKKVLERFLTGFGFLGVLALVRPQMMAVVISRGKKLVGKFSKDIDNSEKPRGASITNSAGYGLKHGAKNDWCFPKGNRTDIDMSDAKVVLRYFDIFAMRVISKVHVILNPLKDGDKRDDKKPALNLNMNFWSQARKWFSHVVILAVVLMFAFAHKVWNQANWLVYIERIEDLLQYSALIGLIVSQFKVSVAITLKRTGKTIDTIASQMIDSVDSVRGAAINIAANFGAKNNADYVSINPHNKRANLAFVDVSFRKYFDVLSMRFRAEVIIDLVDVEADVIADVKKDLEKNEVATKEVVIESDDTTKTLVVRIDSELTKKGREKIEALVSETLGSNKLKLVVKVVRYKQ